MKNDAKTQENTNKEAKAREFPCDRLKKFIKTFYAGSFKAFAKHTGLSIQTITYTFNDRTMPKIFQPDHLNKFIKSGINLNWYLSGEGEMAYDATKKKAYQVPEKPVVNIEKKRKSAVATEASILRLIGRLENFENMAGFNKEYLSTKEALNFMGISQITFSKIRKEGIVNVYGNGRTNMFKREELSLAIESRSQKQRVYN